MAKRNWEIAGICGFMLSGFIYTYGSVSRGDWMSTAGNIVWIAACILWLVPLLRGES